MFARSLCCLALVGLLPAAIAGIDLDREIILAPVSGDSVADAEIRRWQQRVDAPAARLADYERLGWAFVTKARRSLDPGFYKLAEKTADVMDAQFGAAPDAALLRGHVYHNLHRFAEAEIIARSLVERRGTPEDLALLSDVVIEQGKVEEAISVLQRLANFRPGPEVDSRIAHVRWLKGDLRGAIAAMTQAARETSPLDAESLAWIYVRLAGFYLQSGDVAQADSDVTAALKNLPDFAPALLARGKVRLAQHQPNQAVEALARAVEINPLPEYQWWLADALHLCGENVKADAVQAEMARHGDAADPRTYSIFLATSRGAAELALSLARAELETRADVLTHDAVAWATWAKGDMAEAGREIRLALAEGTRDPRLLLHAAVIATAAGKLDDARTFFAGCERGAAALLPSERALLDGIKLQRAALSSPAIGRDEAPLFNPSPSAQPMMHSDSVAAAERL
jgi:tetratricopeptide (TPR) repeat protein